MISTEAGEVRLGKPTVYQGAGTRESLTFPSSQPRIPNPATRPVDASYLLSASNQLRFEVRKYDPRKTLVIDPTLNFISTFGGDDAGEGKGIAVDTAGNSYVAGWGGGAGFPTTPGAFDPTLPGDALVQKIDPSGTLVYSTYLTGSTALTEAFAIAIDSSGDADVTGETSDQDFPVLNAFQATLAGATDVFVTEFNPTGSALVYSSYLGGALNNASRGGQIGYAIAVGSSGAAYVTGFTHSSDFPTLNAFQPVFVGGPCPLELTYLSAKCLELRVDEKRP